MHPKNAVIVQGLILVAACASPISPPKDAKSMAEAQAQLASDPAQGKLWKV